MAAAVRRVGFGLAFSAPLATWLAAIAPVVLAATPAPPAIHADPATGAPGQAFTLTGEGLTPGGTYQLLICPTGDLAGTPCGYTGANLIGLSQVTAAADGSVPAGTSGTIPDLVAGAFAIEAVSGSAVVASTPFTVTSPTISLSAASGPAGLVVAMSGTGFAGGASYSACIVAATETACGYTGIGLVDVTADATGSLAAGSTVTIPGTAPGAYLIGVYLKGANALLIATASFSVDAPSLTVDPTTAPGGSSLTVAGSGYAPGAHYVVCLVPANATECGGAGTYIGSFTADAGGAVPGGTLANLSSPAAGSYGVGVLLESNTATLLVVVPFSVTSGTPVPAPTTAVSSPAGSTGAPATPAPSTAGSQASSSDGGSMLWLILIIALIVIAIVVFLALRRRRPEPTRPT